MTVRGNQMMEVTNLVRSEFLEMPDLRLSTDEARRLWRLDLTDCEAVLSALVDARFLARTRDGRFVRSDANLSRHPIGR
jgi:hypothetical protein